MKLLRKSAVKIYLQPRLVLLLSFLDSITNWKIRNCMFPILLARFANLEIFVADLLFFSRSKEKFTVLVIIINRSK
jgi:hypothetical protein